MEKRGIKTRMCISLSNGTQNQQKICCISVGLNLGANGIGTVKYCAPPSGESGIWCLSCGVQELEGSRGRKRGLSLGP